MGDSMSLHATLTAFVNDSATLVFAIRNEGTDPIDLVFRSGLKADIEVTHADTGAKAWQWSDGKMFTQALQTETLQPDGTMQFRYIWEDPQPGTYVATATLEANVEVRATTRVSIDR